MINEEPLSGTLNLTIQDLNNKINAIYRHGVLQEEYSRQVHDYGEGNLMTETEAHTLEYICDNNEVTVTHLAETFFRTKGTISKLLARLEEKGLITRMQKDGNKKWVYFKPTEKGLRANELHCSYDRVKTLEMLEALLKDCTIEEIESFYKVTALRTLFLEKRRQTDTSSL